jgi:hypothetical protein
MTILPLTAVGGYAAAFRSSTEAYCVSRGFCTRRTAADPVVPRAGLSGKGTADAPGQSPMKTGPKVPSVTFR